MVEPTFSYQRHCPLPSASTHVRLLELIPSPQMSAVITCTLQVYPVTEAPRYEALSYAWGSDNKTGVLFFQRQGYISVTPSLSACLRHLRHPSERRCLWIDQVCINQADNFEKGCQVRLMSKIYSLATRVLAWVGVAENGSDQLMDKFEEAGTELRSLKLEDYPNKERFADMVGLRGRHGQPYRPSAAVVTVRDRIRVRFGDSGNAATEFFQRPWFRRIWVIQEFALGKNVVIQCGAKAVQAEPVFWVLLLLRKSSTHISPAWKIRHEQAALKRLLQLSEADSLHYLMLCRRRIQLSAQQNGIPRQQGMTLYEHLKALNLDALALATDARDRIFGILALCSDADRLGIVPDYGEASTVARVYTRAARAMADGGSIEFLNLCRLPAMGEASSDGLPSWVPDWRAALQPSFCQVSGDDGDDDDGDDGMRLFAAGGLHGTRPAVLRTLDENILGVQGCPVGEVESLGEPWYGLDQETADSESDWDEIQDAVAEVETRRYRAAQSFLEDVRRLCLQAAAKHTNTHLSAVAQDMRDRFMEAEWKIPCGDIVKSPLPERRKVRATREARDAYTAVARLIKLRASNEGLREASDRLTLDADNLEAHMDNMRAQMHNLRAMIGSLGVPNIAQAEPERLQAGPVKLEEAEEEDRVPRGLPAAGRVKLEEAEEEEDLVPRDQQKQNVFDYQERMQKMRNMRPFMTVTGHVGMAPLETKAGDLVVVFLGACTPFVVRPVEGRKSKLVGEAYCYRAMDGEIISRGHSTEFYLV